MSIRSIKTEVFKYGIVDIIEDRAIPRGAARKSLNWLTMGDRIELRRGFSFMGDSSQQTGSGKATSLKRATDALSVEVLFYTYGQKAKYYDNDTEEFVEIGSDLLGSDADGEEISLSEYTSNSGNQIWMNSPNCAGFFKIMVANPGNAVDQFNSSKNHKGHIKIDTNSCFLWRRVADKTGLYRSYIDAQNFTTVSSEALSDVSSATLAFKSGGAKRTCFGITITHTGSGEIYSDNYDGTLTGDGGGTGTINYATGAVTTNRSGAGTADYQWEDSTNGGLADFTGAGTAGQGVTFRQDEGGGPLQSVATYASTYFCFHEKKTWALVIALDDDHNGTSNLPYRQNVGIPSTRGHVETGEGIYYIDVTTDEDPAVRLLTYERGGSDQIIPIPVSDNIVLSDYRFDQAVGGEFGDFILFACRLSSSAKNNRTLLYNRQWKSWDVLDYAINGGIDTFNGALVAGDSLTNNVMTLFSGLADDDSIINNYWEGKLDDLDIEGLKKTKKLRLRGGIGIDQAIKVSLSADNGPFVEVKGPDDGATDYAIQGTGDYVDQGTPITVGPLTLGRGEIGGGGSGIEAYPYERLFKIPFDKFDSIVMRVEAVKIGYASLSMQEFWDVRFKGKKVPRKYRG